MRRKFFGVYLLIILMLGLSACGMYPLQVNIKTSSILNLDQYYRSLPVKIHVYELKNDDEFKQAGFHALWLKPKAVLGESLLKVSSFTLSPGEDKSIRLAYDPRTNYIAVVAIFRKPTYKQWRAITKISHKIPIIIKRISIGLVGNRVSIR